MFKPFESIGIFQNGYLLYGTQYPSSAINFKIMVIHTIASMCFCQLEVCYYFS